MNAHGLKKLAAHLFLPLLCAVLLLAGPIGESARAVSEVTARLRPDYTIIIDGSKRLFYNAKGQQVHPISYNGTTYLPLRAIGELMGKNVDWNADTKTATLSGTRTGAAVAGTPDASAKAQDITAALRDDITVVVDQTSRTFTDANGQTVYPLFYDGSNYLPIRAIGELMGKTVEWDGKTNTITLGGGMDLDVTDADSFSDGTSSAKPGETSGGLLSAESAKAKALAHAGLTDAAFTKLELEWDNGRQVYDLEFYAGDSEYDYELDAVNGTVLSYEIKSGTPTASSAITLAKAQEIALSKVPGAAASHIRKLELDWDDGRQIYEVEIMYQGVEYEMEIDAATGAIVDYDVDYD